MDQQILAQAIDVYGNIDPSWVLTVITGVAGLIIWTQIRDMKGDIKEMVGSINELLKTVARNDKRISLINFKLNIKEGKDDD